MERFLAICHPLHLYTMSGLQRAVRIIVALWIISFLSAVPFAVFSDIDYLNYPPSEYILITMFCHKTISIFIVFILYFFIYSERKTNGFSILCNVGVSRKFSTLGAVNVLIFCISNGCDDSTLW